MAGTVIAVMTGLMFAYALVARRLNRINVTAPMLSLLAGTVVFSFVEFDIDTQLVHVVAELTLVVILFHDASTVKLSQLRNDPRIAIRLLLIGFPLALIATFALTWAVLPALGVAGAWLLAGAITPTDAGLGAPTVLNPVVPTRVRRGLNVESGLNDGLATPIVLLALAALSEQEGVTEPGILQVGLVPLLMAVVLAVAVGLVSAWCMDRSRTYELSSKRGRTFAALALPLGLFGLSAMLGANAFIAAFVGGLVFGAACTTLAAEHETASLIEVTADLLGFVVWFFAGGLLPVVFEQDFSWKWPVVALLALTVLRLIPVTLALLGSGFKWPTVLFFGWFGPRGLATIVFGLLAVEDLGVEAPVVSDLTGVIAFTVLFSVFAHGFTAGPLAAIYGTWAHRTHAPIEQEPSVEPMRTRGVPASSR